MRQAAQLFEEELAHALTLTAVRRPRRHNRLPSHAMLFDIFFLSGCAGK